MKKIRLLALMIISISISAVGQNNSNQTSDEISYNREYSFMLMDSPHALFTMKQFNQNYLSLYRISVNELNKAFSQKASSLIQLGLSLITIPLTHEEGHRSVLTINHIGSVSNPFFDKTLTASIKGVPDQTLINMRDHNLPSFIRLHTAGLESDYHLLLSESSLLHWGKEDYNVLGIEYLMRKFNLMAYYFSGAIGYDIKIEEPDNELQRDIVGHDIYGAIRHLHRPDMPFYRYTRLKDLTGEERKYARRVGWLSLLNLVDPVLFGKDGWELKNGYKINGGLGYGMTSFGDFLDEHVWLKGSCFNVHAYFRQYNNKDRWFPAMGITIDDLFLNRNIKSTFSLHGWSQPESLNFNTADLFWGGAVDCKLQYIISLKKQLRLSALSVDMGLIAKSDGFMTGEAKLDSQLGIYAGFSIFLR